MKNISSQGVQVKAFAPLKPGTEISLTVGDADALRGNVVWFRAGLAGIRFQERLAPDALLRATALAHSDKRRAAPRVRTDARATLRTGGEAFGARICDISTSGAKVKTTRPVPTTGAAVLEVRDLPPLTCYIRWIDDVDLGLSFSCPMPIAVITGWLSGQTTVTSA